MSFARRSISWGFAAAPLLFVLGGCGKVVPRPAAHEPVEPAAIDEPVAVDEPAAEDEAPAADGAAVAPKATGAMPDPLNGILEPGQADLLLTAADSPRLELETAGEPPRAPLEFALQKGAKESLKMRMAMDITAAGAKAAPQPPIEMTFELTVGAADERGEFPVSAVLKGVEVKPATPDQAQVANLMREPLSQLSGLSFAYAFTKSGMHRGFALKEDAKLQGPQKQIALGIVQSYRSTATPFPAEPVGVGAKWRVISRHPDAGADLMQIAECELVERDGNKVRIEIETKQLAASADVAALGLAQGVSPRLTRFSSGGTGETTFDTTRAAVVASTSTVATQMSLSFVQNGRPVSSAVEQKVTIDFEAVPGAPTKPAPKPAAKNKK